MIFFLEVSCVKNYHFFTAPRWSPKALFCTIFFSPNIDFDHRSVHLGWFIWVFWEFMVKKMINFPAQWHIKEFYNSNFFEFWIFWFKSLLWLFGKCISCLPGFIGKMRRNENDFFSRGVMCEKLPFFHSPAVVRKGTFLHNFFFSEYRFWSQVGASGVFIWVFWEFMMKKW